MIYVPQVLPLTQVQIAIRLGAVADPVGQEGLASLALALLETGTETLSRRAFESRLDTLGAHFALTTSSDYALVSLEVLSDKLRPAFDLLYEVLTRPALDAAELERLRRLQRQEIIAAQDDDRSVGSRLFRQFLFRYGGYGRPSHGTLASVDRLRHDDVVAFAKERLLSGPATLGVCSDQPREVFEEFASRLGLQWTDAPALADLQPHDGKGGLRVLLVDKPERTQCQSFVGAPGPAGAGPAPVPLQVGNTVLGGTFTSRLVQEIREKRGLSYGAGSSLTSFLAAGYFQARFFPNRDKVVDAICIARDVIDGWVARGVTDDELDFVREYLTNQFHFRLETPSMELYQRLVNRLIGRPVDHLETYLPALSACTRDSVNQAISEAFARVPWYVGVVATADGALEDELRQRLHPDQIKVVAYTDELLP
jgi:zinc protease